jgi:membrane protease YdiL (CAAX protease family)
MNQQPPQVSLHTDGERRGPRPVLPVLLIAAGLIAIGVSMVFRHTLGRGEQGQTAVLQYEFAARAGYRSWLLSSYVSRGSVRPAEARRSADAQGVAQTLARLVSADPSSVKARVWYAAFLGEIGRDGEAAAQIAQARRLLTEPGAAEADSLAALQRLYERTAAFGTPDDVAAIADLNSSIDLDVFGPLVQEKVHEVLGDDARAKEIEHAEQLRALAWWTKVIVMFAASAVAVLAGLVVGIVHLVARSRSSEGWRRPAKAIPAAPLAVVVLVFIVLTLGVPVLAKFVVGLATGTEPGELSARFIVTWAVGEEIVIAAFCVWVASGVLSGSGLSLRDIGLKVGTGAKNVLRGIGGYLAALPIMIVAALIGYLLFVKVVPLETPANPMFDLVAAADDRWVLVGAFLLGSVLAPVIEEIVFRGMLQSILRAKVGVWGGILGSSAVFAGLHPQLPMGFLPLFGIGCVLAYLYQMTDSLVPSMLAHSLNNTIATIVMLQVMG